MDLNVSEDQKKLLNCKDIWLSSSNYGIEN